VNCVPFYFLFTFTIIYVLFLLFTALFRAGLTIPECDNYERGNVRISSITMFQCFRLNKFKKKFYILSEASK